MDECVDGSMDGCSLDVRWMFVGCSRPRKPLVEIMYSLAMFFDVQFGGGYAAEKKRKERTTKRYNLKTITKTDPILARVAVEKGICVIKLNSLRDSRRDYSTASVPFYPMVASWRAIEPQGHTATRP